MIAGPGPSQTSPVKVHTDVCWRDGCVQRPTTVVGLCTPCAALLRAESEAGR